VQGKGAPCTSPTCPRACRRQRSSSAGGPPLICGRALRQQAARHRWRRVAFFGDGASNQGTTLESLNLATVWNLPAIFVAENNGYAEATSSTWSVATDDIADRAAAFGMPG